MSVDHITLTKLNELLIKEYGPSWFELEHETISLDMGVVFSELFWQKVSLLKVLLRDARSFEVKLEEFNSGVVGPIGFDEPRIYTDPLFAIYACDLINNIEIEPATIAMPTLFELAYALKELGALPISFNPSESEVWKMLSENVLKEEGVDRPVPPFMFVDPALFPEKARTDDELKMINVAIKAYISLMEAGEGEKHVDD